MRIDTGIDIPALLDLRAKLARWLGGETLRGALALAGLPLIHESNPAIEALRTI
jgi:hydroxymethylglutaryl-CoA lyase